jgi:hypothetical protein
MNISEQAAVSIFSLEIVRTCPSEPEQPRNRLCDPEGPRLNSISLETSDLYVQVLLGPQYLGESDGKGT